jgi:hypothetical protein
VGLAPDVVAQPVHTGHSALKLGGTAGVTFTSGVTQSAVLTDSWEPVLSFWYNPVETGGDDRFNVVLTMVSQAAGAAQSVTVTQVLTPTLDVTGWTHLAHRLGPLDTALSGTVTLIFQLWHTPGSNPVTSILYLDEVSLGGTMGGPHKAYVPLVWKRH